MSLPIYSVAITDNASQLNELLACYEVVTSAVKKGQTFSSEQQVAVCDVLSRILNETLQHNHISLITDKPIFQILHLIHEDHRILNLPWHWIFNDRPFIYLCKGFELLQGAKPESRIATPIRILFIISSPFNTHQELAFETEYKEVYNSLGNLLKKGEAIIDILEEGSLNRLKDKISSTFYDIVHFIGHSKTAGSPTFETENPDDLQSEFIAYREFAFILSEADKLPSLIYLSSCDTATGDSATKSATQHLLETGIPYVISMGHNVTDQFSIDFSSFFYGELADSRDIVFAFNQAQRKLSDLEESDAELVIPQLFISPASIHIQKVSKGVQGSENPFIGRVQELRLLVKHVLARETINIIGPAGIGKRTLVSEALRKLATTKHAIEVVYIKGESTEKIIISLEMALSNRGISYDDLQNDIPSILISLKEKCIPVLVYVQEDENISNEVRGIITLLINEASVIPFSFILINRHQSEEQNFQGIVMRMKAPDFIDFYRKCSRYEIFRELEKRSSDSAVIAGTLGLKGEELSAQRYKGMIHMIYDHLEGNYKKLDEFVAYLNRDFSPDNITGVIILRELYRSPFIKELLIDDDLEAQLKLVEELSEDETEVLSILDSFEAPVEVFGFGFFGDKAYSAILKELETKQIIESYHDKEKDLQFFSVTKMFSKKVAYVLSSKNKNLVEADFNSKAIRYYEHIYTFYHSKGILEKIVQHYLVNDDNQELAQYGIPFVMGLYNNQLVDETIDYSLKLLTIFENTADKNALMHIYPILGNAYRDNGQHDLALKAYNSYFECASALNEKFHKAIAMDNIAMAYTDLRNYVEALRFNKDSLSLFEELGDTNHKARCLINAATIYYRINDVEKAIENFLLSINLSEKTWDMRNLQSAYNDLAVVYVETGNFESALVYYEKSIKLLIDSGEYKKAAITYINIGNAFIKTNNYSQAIVFLSKALLLAERINDNSILGNVYREIGFLKYLEGAYDEAYKTLQLSYKYYEQSNSEDEKYLTVSYIGDVARAQSDRKRAIEMYSACIVQFEKSRHYDHLVTTLNRLALVYLDNEDNQSAFSAITKAEELCKRKNIGHSRESITNTMAMVLCAMGKTEEAMAIFEKTVHLDSDYHKGGSSKSFQNMGATLFKKKDFHGAISFFNKSITIKRELGDIKGIATTAGSMGQTYISLEDFAMAKIYLEEAFNALTELKDYPELMKCQYSLCYCHLMTEEYELAKQYGEQAADVCQHLRDTRQLALVLQLLSDVHNKLGDEKKRMETLFHAYYSISPPSDIDLTLKIGAKMIEFFEETGKDKEAEIIHSYLMAMAKMLNMYHDLVINQEEKD